MHFCYQKWFEHDKSNWWTVKNICPIVWDNQILEKISENILEYYQKGEIVFIRIFVIKGDLNMIEITGGLFKMFAQLSRTTKFWKRNGQKIGENVLKYHQKSKIVLNASLLSEMIWTW